MSDGVPQRVRPGSVSAQSRTRPLRRALAFALVAVAIVAFGSGCSKSAPPASGQAPRLASQPTSITLTTPETAVESYLAWTAWAFTMANSDLATPTMTPEEEVRVNSYVQLNKEKQRVIDQRLTVLKFGKVTVEATRAIVPASESWEYRYLSIDGKRVVTPTYTARYETTYTVSAVAPDRWLVDSVEAKALDELK